MVICLRYSTGIPTGDLILKKILEQTNFNIIDVWSKPPYTRDGFVKAIAPITDFQLQTYYIVILRHTQ
ncbi:hypothetical protein [Okeania sp. KiyG1]|uniref:hypothetical protein n=1 Tax=Okeania sp. KiyG1 TaxID=2720165 RepID=UPI00192504EA|nr:hypothetical protein [Okeania sp. KiyG1]